MSRVIGAGKNEQIPAYDQIYKQRLRGRTDYPSSEIEIP